MLSIREIYVEYQLPYYDRKKINSWLTRKLYSRAATPIIKLLLYTSVSANQVTIGWVLLGIFSCYLLTFGSYAASLAGAFLIQVHIILDYVDGPIARIKKASLADSKRGLYIERVGHDLIFTIFFYCISIGAVRNGFRPLPMLNFGFFASIGYFFYKYTRRAKVYCALSLRVKEKCSNGQADVNQRSMVNANVGKNPLKVIYRKAQPLWDPVFFTSLAFLAFLFDRGYLIPIFYGSTYPLQFIVSYVYQAKIDDRWVLDMAGSDNG